MIRISKADEPARTTITVDGRFTGSDYIETLISYSDILCVTQEGEEVLDTGSSSGLARRTTAAPPTTADREIPKPRGIMPARIAVWTAVCSTKT